MAHDVENWRYALFYGALSIAIPIYVFLYPAVLPILIFLPITCYITFVECVTQLRKRKK